MCQTANSSLESTRRKFFMNSRYIMSRKQESNVLGQEAEMILKEISSLGSARGKFFMNSTHIISKSVGIKRFFAQEAKMCQTANSSLESTRRKFFMNTTYIMSRN